jgi:serine protease AprX
MRLTRREFAKLLALSLGLGTTGLPLVRETANAKEKDPATGALDPTLPLHPLLQYGALVEPDKKVEVIVQKVSKSAKGKDIAADGEGEDLEEFAFIKSHFMRVKQGKLPKLAARKDVLYISPNAAVQRHAVIDPSKLLTTYPKTINADDTWNHSNDWGGTGIGATIAVLDTGLTAGADFGAGVIPVNLNARSSSVADKHGHGTHVAGIIKGRSATGTYIGVAPNATLISAKIADDTGQATTADLLRGLQWIYTNRYGGSGPIKVVNLSITAGTPESYKTSAICAAVEQLWFSGITVVCAAGNRGADRDATWYPPSNDPYVITAGATDENGSSNKDNDLLATFSSRGTTQDGMYKPDIYAPGRKIIAPLASPDCTIARLFPDRMTGDGYIRLSGTSMAAPIIAGAIALLLGRYPQLTPDQVKWILLNKAQPFKNGPDGKPLLGIQQSAQWVYNPKNAIGTANQGLTPNINIVTTTNGSVSPTQAYWDQAYWDQAYWDQAYWDQAYWDTVSWDLGLAYD